MLELDILMICRQNEKYFLDVFPKLQQKLKKFNITWYIYENNSQDKTGEILMKLASDHNNIKVLSEKTVQYRNKYVNITLARKELTRWYLEQQHSDSLWVLWLHTNIIFNDQTITELLLSQKNNPSGMMFCSFTTYLDNNINQTEWYYDILAYNYGKFFRTERSPCLTWLDMCHDNIHINDNIDINDINNNEIKIETGFGGLVLLKKDMLVKCLWGIVRPMNVTNKNIPSQIICEHWNFSQQINNYGDIFMVKNANAIWFMDRHLNSHKINQLAILFLN